jgi:amino acid transporter
MTWLKSIVLGRARSLEDHRLFHKLSLVALLAWVGLGADGLSSSCYGPEETFRSLGANPHLAIFVALASVVTIAVICASYAQIIALFPSGGGGYLVASKLLSPSAGVVSGSALLIDYVLTITVSVAGSADALFSLLPPAWLEWKLAFALAGVALLTVVNLRGVKEAVMLWVPVFAVFVLTHLFLIGYALLHHAAELPALASSTATEVHRVSREVGVFGLLAVILRAYSMGAGTYTGIEAVSNGLPILREPRVQTGRRTMLYMGVSLALTVAGLLLAYLLYRVTPAEGKTLNAVLLGQMTAPWPATAAHAFIWLTLVSEAALLLVAAQTGFLDGPRVLANLALDRWLPTRFANLSDRLVTQNGILWMGGCAFVMMLLTRGAIGLLVVLYSINVFITFSLSQLGMVRHWWRARQTEPHWRRRLAVNGAGLVLTSFILISLTVVKFREGGWATLLVTGLFVAAAFGIRRHYDGVSHQLHRLDTLLMDANSGTSTSRLSSPPPEPDPQGRTAVLLVNGYNGLGLHTALHVPRMFGRTFRNFVFLHVGIVDAGNFKGAEELTALRRHADTSLQQYTRWAHAHGYAAATYSAIGHDVVTEASKLAAIAAERFPNSVFFAGQLLFARETRVTRWLHNSTAFALQRRFFLENRPFVILPIRVAN